MFLGGCEGLVVGEEESGGGEDGFAPEVFPAFGIVGSVLCGWGWSVKGRKGNWGVGGRGLTSLYHWRASAGMLYCFAWLLRSSTSVGKTASKSSIEVDIGLVFGESKGWGKSVSD